MLFTFVILFITGCGESKEKQENNQLQNVTEQESTENTDNKKSTEEEKKIAITSGEQEIKIEVGETKALSYVIAGGSKDTVLSFQSGDTSKMTVDENGKVTGVAEGQTYVVVKSGDAECYWNVTIIPTAKINTNISGIDIMIYNNSSNVNGYYKKQDGTEEAFYRTVYLDYSIEGGDSSYDFSLKSLDESVVKVSNDGMITPVNDGDTTIVASYGDRVTCSWDISVEKRIVAIVSRIEGDTMYYYEALNSEELSDEYLEENDYEDAWIYNGGGEEKNITLNSDIQYIEYDYDINQDVTIDKETFVKKFNDAVEQNKQMGYDCFEFDEYGYYHGFPVYIYMKNGKVSCVQIPFFS